MKKFMFIAVLLFSIASYSQYDRWSFDAEIGSHIVSDESAILNDYGLHLGAGVRYNLNERFGIGFRAGYDRITMYNPYEEKAELAFKRVAFEGTLNVLDLLDLRNNVFALHFHGGPGMAFLDNDYDEYTFNMSGGITGLFKVTEWLAIRTDFTSIANINHDKTLDATQILTNVGINSVVHNFSIGLTFYPGKAKQHADWVSTEKDYFIVNNSYISPITKETINNSYTTRIVSPLGIEYVVFYNDETIINDYALNAVLKVYNALDKDSGKKLLIKGYASATSNSDAYNKDLSARRTQSLQGKLIDMGVDASRIQVQFYGKDYKWKDLSSHDVARRVELIIY